MTTLIIPVNAKDHILGPESAPITLVEYGDFQCPFCGSAYLLIKRILNEYGEQIRFVFRHFPLTEVHPLAENAAEVSEVAADHDRFWQMHDLIYENQKQLTVPFLMELGETLKLPASELELALIRKTFEERIREDFLSGVRSGVNGTPTFFINGERFNDPFTDLKQVLGVTLNA